MWAITFLSVLL